MTQLPQWPTLTPTGQPRMGSKFTIPTWDGTPPVPVKIVGKLFGRGSITNVVGIIVESLEDGGRATLEWPLTRDPDRSS